MSSFEKTVRLLSSMQESDINIIYDIAQSLNKQREAKKNIDSDELEKVFKRLVGAVPDSGKSLEEYRIERLRGRYGTAD